MQKINYKEEIQFESPVKELLMINIDEKLNQESSQDTLNVKGTITISGEVNLEDEQNKQFTHPIDVDILLSNEQLVNNEINIGVDDFNYTINDNKILIDLYLKIDGLKEIEAYFSTEEDSKDPQIEEVQDHTINNQENLNEEPPAPIIALDIVDNKQQIETAPMNEPPQEALQSNPKNKFSLLEQVFKNRSIKKESTYLLHVVKQETSYSEISDLYKVDIESLKRANNGEEIVSGKLIFISKNQ